MQARETRDALLMETAHADGAIIGFTRPSLRGNPSEDTPRALSFVKTDFGTCYMKQVHGAEIKFIDKPGQYVCDGLFTASDNIALVVKTADCMPILLYSPKEGIAGAIHMGWRSAKEGILDNITFDLSSFTVVAGVGMRKCCYRVGKEFLGYDGMSAFLENRNGAYYFDPAEFAKAALMKKGLPKDRFFDYNICSYCSKEGYHSHRKTSTEDRTLSFVMKLKSQGQGDRVPKKEGEKDEE